eukprot:TRINITY_DN7674_c0_g2_i1.p1 TRINITY_DN7674_c0_g2~~TRINITY_DN7674_c0_g2_i1.p1  ORF type:complete len:110 (-),score=7.64 TRINITY_DN7674_c0_g2_i1:27-356(-)
MFFSGPVLEGPFASSRCKALIIVDVLLRNPRNQGMVYLGLNEHLIQLREGRNQMFSRVRGSTMCRARTRLPYTCLLYTSDAADEEDSGDLGGRRIIKKKRTRQQNTKQR